MKSSVNNFRVFAGKELTENLRAKRLFALVCIFVFIGILSVLTARFIGEIFELILSADGGTPFIIEVPDPVWTDSYAQFYSNITEMGLFAYIMLFMGAILKEKSSGTIDLMMAKGLTATGFVLSKFAVAAVLSLLVLLATVLMVYVYTFALFEYGGNIGNVLHGALPFAAFMLMMLAITLMWSAIAKSTAISAVLGIGSFFAFIPLNLIPWVGRFMPGRLVSHGVALSAGGSAPNLGIQILVALGFGVIALWVAIVVLRRREG